MRLTLAWSQSDADMIIHGRFYTGSDSGSRPARLTLVAGRLQLQTESPEHVRDLHASDITLSPRVGNTARYLYLSDDGVFETSENDQVDALAQQLQQGLAARLMHRLERNLGLILIAVLVTALTTTVVFTHGIPAMSALGARAIPADLTRKMSQETLEQLDDFLLAPSTLSAERQQRLLTHFAPLLASEPDYQFQVLFRSGIRFGANAFALPDGTIVFTDELVELAEHPDELSAVLAHEMGHVVANHGLRGVVQSSLVGWMIVLMTGDLSAASDMVVVAPAVLMNLSYSRSMEREADLYALNLMLAESLDPIHFSNLMRRLAGIHGPADPAAETNWWDEQIDVALSSHPPPHERVEQFEQAAREQQ